MINARWQTPNAGDFGLRMLMYKPDFNFQLRDNHIAVQLTM
jgi:hypothetical protein